jgi:hypothetical protein
MLGISEVVASVLLLLVTRSAGSHQLNHVHGPRCNSLPTPSHHTANVRRRPTWLIAVAVVTLIIISVGREVAAEFEFRSYMSTAVCR